ncbi:hypothetical protein LLH00_19010 [bacterium]|nr:hypothetical protein [bacterium]
MSKVIKYSPAKVAAACDQALSGILDSLDRSHYPESLYTLLRQVLLPRGSAALRSTAILTAAAEAWRGRPHSTGVVLAAQEMLLRGWFLQAAFLMEKPEDYSEGLGGKVWADQPQALLLLAADTLFTLPFEILARQGTEQAVAVLDRLSGRFGPAGVLRSLNEAGASLEAFLEENPLLALAAAAAPDLPDGYAFSVLARYCYLREARDWFGREQVIGCRLSGVLDRRDCLGLAEDRPPGSLYSAVYKYLGK